MSKYANATWQGGKDGKGTVSTETKTLSNAPFTFASRFGEEKNGTNPEELIAAAHASCFSMKLSIILMEAGFPADNIETRSDITFGKGMISQSHLTVTASIPGITEEEFKKHAEDAKENCPVSKSLNSDIEITMDATLKQ